ncbi:30S ribosomal protein S3 [bacterium]|nr:30S ribosomal protein S3 [bacterium]
MGQKANPNGMRLGIIKDWDANWFSDNNYASLVMEDYLIRNYLKKELFKGGVSKIVINRKADATEANVHIARPGLIFGKSSVDTSHLVEDLKKLVNRLVRVNIIEEKNVEMSSRLVGEWVAFQLEKRVPFRRVMKMAVQKSLKAGALGVKVTCSGRLGGAEIARSEWYREGKVPLHTLRADIDFAFSEALTTYGKIGIKVWIYKGEILRPSRVSRATAEAMAK